jgi:hypothetical protein
MTFLEGATNGLARGHTTNLRKYQKIPKNIKKYEIIPKNTKKYQIISENTKKYQRIPKDINKQHQKMTSMTLFGGPPLGWPGGPP